MNPSNALGSLIDACLDDRRMLVHEREVVSPERARVLDELATERFHFVEDLRGALGSHDVREHGGSWRELGRELRRGLRVKLGLGTQGDAMNACRRSCIRTEERFDKALDLPLPAQVRAIVLEQRTRLASAHEVLGALQF